MQEYDVGDIARFVLNVDPAGQDTAATIVVHDPDGQIVATTPTPSGNNTRWSANVVLNRAGVWRATWTVQGTGAGVESLEVIVRPDPEAATGRSYATLGDLVEYTGANAPPGAARRLVRASRTIDEILYGSGYRRDDTTGYPLDARVIAGMRDAVCAQVEWLAANGDPDGVGGGDRWDNVKIGSVSLSRGAGAGAAAAALPPLAPGAVRALRLAGLLPITPWVVG